jgi:hypothetical protein
MPQLTHAADRFLAMGMAAASAAAMFYVGLYQSRAVKPSRPSASDSAAMG